MNMSIGLVTLVIKDYDEAIDFFVGKLGFTLMEDTDLDESKRWVVVSAGAGTDILLAKANGVAQENAVGNQTGGRVGFFLKTDDFEETAARFKRSGIRFCEEPRIESYGKVAVFEDLCGNRWDLLENRR